jgi:His/Glu/Gln/Arg/opine family amino acid ABC transporter permease subunit
VNFDTRALWQALPYLLQGLEMTIVLVLGALAVGTAIGLVACAGKLLGRGLLAWLAYTYVGLFRGLPEMVLVFWMYYCGPLVFDTRLSDVSTGIATLSLIAGAYLCEIFRAGIQAVPKGQIEAAQALGLSGFWIGWSVIAPQAIRIMIPTFVGFLTILLKNSSLISAIGVAELFYQASTRAATTYKYLEIYTAVGIIYFLLIFPLSMMAQRAERKLAAARQ